MSNKSWQETLVDIFGGYINQQTLEEGVAGMVFVSEDEPGWHQQFEQAIRQGVEAARQGDVTVIGIVNQSGYRVGSVEEAEALLRELDQVYSQLYKAAVSERE
jgi:hypothetical protein